MHPVTCISVTIDVVWILKLDLLTTLTHDSWLHLIIATSLIPRLHKSLQHKLNFFSLLHLHQSFLGNGFQWWRFFSIRSQLVVRWLSIAPTKSSFHRLPYNSLTLSLVPIVLIITSRHGPLRKHRYLFTPIISVVICLFSKALLSNGCVYLLIKNLLLAADIVSLFVSRSLPSNGPIHCNTNYFSFSSNNIYVHKKYVLTIL
jgi:hypothetical protein